MFEPDQLDATICAALRNALRAAKYDDAVLARAEAIAPRQVDAVRLPAVRWRLRADGDRASLCARLFAYEDEASEGETASVLGAEVLEALVRTGALRREGARIRSTIRLLPFGSTWIASDPMDAGGDPVMGPGATTLELARCIDVREGERVADIGCGAGSLALWARMLGPGKVVATDIHARAAAFVRLNARLCDVDIDVRTGDLTTPLRDERFDLVLAQPPFVVHPPEIPATTYLHGGLRGDELALKLLGELPRILAPGGRALVLVEAPEDPAAPLWRRISEAVGPGIWQLTVLVAPGHTLDEQAIGYAAITHPTLGPDYARAVLTYRDHLAQLGVERFVRAIVELRRPISDESGWAVTVERPSLRGLSAATLRSLRRGLELATADEARIRGTRLGVAPDACVVQEQSVVGDQVTIRVRFGNDGRPAQELSDAAALVIDLARSPIALDELIVRYAELASASPAEVRAAVVDFVRSALVSGLLVPARTDPMDPAP